MDDQAVYDGLDCVFNKTLQFWRLIEISHLSVDAGTDVTLRAQSLQHVRVLAFTAMHDGGQQHQARALGIAHHMVHHLTDRLGLQASFMIGASGLTDPRVEQAQVVINLGDGADRRSRIMGDGFLLDGYRWREALYRIDVGFLHQRQELARIGRERFNIAALAFGVKRVESQGGFAGAREPSNDYKPIAGQIDV